MHPKTSLEMIQEHPAWPLALCFPGKKGDNGEEEKIDQVVGELMLRYYTEMNNICLEALDKY